MPRVVAFGCSFTYGHGLPDCYDGKIGCGPNPSNFAWPRLLANKLGYTFANMGKGGSGNTEILWRLLNFNFEVDDVCVIMWSYFDRSNFFRYSNDITGKRIERNHRLLDEEKSVFDENNNITNLLAMSHAAYYLDSLNISSYACVGAYRVDQVALGDRENIQIDEFDFISHDRIKIANLDLSFNMISHVVDAALDGKHPGIRSHQLIAERLYNNLNVIH